MTEVRRSALCLGLAAIAAGALPASAADELANEPRPEVTGDVRAGWRLIGGEGEGRYPQDFGLKDGPRIFELNLYGSDPRPSAVIDDAEAHFTGIGDPNSDYLLRVRHRDVLDVEGGYRRDDMNYRATGDPFPYDTIRERAYVHGTFKPSQALSVRFAWDRNDREGDAFTSANSSQDGSIVQQHRTLSQNNDRFSLGADLSAGVWRFGLDEIVGTTDIDDSRLHEAPGNDPTSEYTRIIVRSKSYTTAAKAGVVLLDGDFDATLFATRTELPLEETPSGRVVDADGVADPLGGSGELRRTATNWRVESSWRPHRDWDVAVSGEQDDIVDEESGTFLVNGFPASTPHARITDRAQRWSGDVSWDATEELRLRLGEEYLREEFFVPTDSHFNVPDDFKRNRPTDFDTTSWRTNVGADWRPSRKLSLSALARISSNDAPQTTAVADQGDDWSLRARWDSIAGERDPAVDRFTSNTVIRWRRLSHSGAVRFYEIDHFPDTSQGEHPGQSTDLGSATRATSVSESASWERGPWSVRGTIGYRQIDTTSDSAFGADDNGFLSLSTTAFRASDVSASADVRYELIPGKLHVFAAASRTSAHGDYVARWFDASVGADYDVLQRTDAATGAKSPLVTVTLEFSTWQLSDKNSSADDYSTQAVELSATYHF